MSAGYTTPPADSGPFQGSARSAAWYASIAPRYSPRSSKIRPIMYLALSYDHRVVDGQGAVTFLVKVKEHIEDPQRLLLDI